MRAFILAGGLGTRLRSVVHDRPKPLASIGDAPFLQYQIEFLRSHDISEFVLLVGYRGRQIHDYFGDGSRWSVSIRYSVERSPLGTAGALKNAERYVDGTFLVLNGDSHFDFDVSKLIGIHEQQMARHNGCLATIALAEVADPDQYGSVALDDDGRIVSFAEKGTHGPPPYDVSAGVYVIEPPLLEKIPRSWKVSLELETFPAVLQSQSMLFGHRADGFFVDIGTPEGLERFRNHCTDHPHTLV